MATNSHSPKPWVAIYSVGAGWEVKSLQEGQKDRWGMQLYHHICSMAWFQFNIEGVMTESISRANAHLIATSPDMAEELISIKNNLSLWDFIKTFHPSHRVSIEQILKKAELNNV